MKTNKTQTEEITLMSDDIKKLVKKFTREVNALIRAIKKDTESLEKLEKKLGAQ